MATITPEMVGAALSLAMYAASNEMTEEILDKLCPIKHLAQDCAEELFRAYCELRAKDGEVIAFVNAYPTYLRCDNNIWHGAIDGKITASRQIQASLNRTDRYSCGSKLKIIRDGLVNLVCDAVTNAVNACNFEFALEDTYYEQKFTFLASSASGSPSSLIAHGFSSASDVLINVSSALQREQQGAAAAFGVFSGRALDSFNGRQQAEQRQAPVTEINVRPTPVNVTVPKTTALTEPSGRIIETERFTPADDSFVK